MASADIDIFELVGIAAFDETPDLTPPVIVFVTSGPIVPETSIQVDVTAENGFGHVLISASYDGGDPIFLVYDTNGYQTNYDGSSSVTPITGGFRFTLTQDDDWYDDVTIEVIATDLNGNKETSDQLIAITSGSGTPLCVKTGPIPVIVIDDTPEYDEDDLTFTVTTGNSNIRMVVVIAEYEDELSNTLGQFVVVIDPSEYTSPLQFDVQPPDGGWYKSPNVDVTIFAYDQLGQEGTQTSNFSIVAGTSVPVSVGEGVGVAPWSLVSPSDFSTLKRRDAIVINLGVDDLELHEVMIAARLKREGKFEVIYHDGSFSDKYKAFSSIVNSPTGKLVSCRRTEGWPVTDHDSEAGDIEIRVLACRGVVIEPPPVS